MKNKSRLKSYLYKNKVTILVYFILRSLVVFSMIRSLLRDDYESVFLGGLTLVLLIIPSILSRKLKLDFPTTFEVCLLLFIFSAEILGEINNFYIKVPQWDTLLHTFNGFLCAALGFALVDLMNRDEHFTFQLSPEFLTLVAFCFSMTVGVLWEFFEFSGDALFGLDMQKDSIITTVNTVLLDPTNSNSVVKLKDISDVIVVMSDGTQKALGLGGYVDIGIIDTMHDLFVNLIGAVAFSVFGYAYLKHKGKGKIASSFIPKVNK